MVGFIVGELCKKIIESKGWDPYYAINWFWLGLFFPLIALICAFCKRKKEAPVNENINSKYYQQTMDNGGWECSYCKKLNAAYVGTCGCGKTRDESRCNAEAVI